MFNYSNFRNTLEDIANDQSEKNTTRVEAGGLVRKFDSLETGFMAVFWDEIMNRYDKTSTILQTVDIDLQTAVELLEGLKSFVASVYLPHLNILIITRKEGKCFQKQMTTRKVTEEAKKGSLSLTKDMIQRQTLTQRLI